VHARGHAVGHDHASERVLVGSQPVNSENAPEVIVGQIPECTLFQIFVDETLVAHDVPKTFDVYRDEVMFYAASRYQTKPFRFMLFRGVVVTLFLLLQL
jgi:hypothetical protein